MIRWSVLLLCLACSSAHAGSGGDLLQRGIRHYTYGEYKQAIQVLNHAGREMRDPKVLAQVYLYLGLSHAVVGAVAQAQRCFITAMTHDPLIQPDPVRIKPDLVSLFSRTRERQRATLRVEADQPDAVAIVDGRPPVRLPLRLAVPIGAHRVEVRSEDGRLRETRKLVLPPGAVVQVSARLGRPVTRSAPASAPTPAQGDRPSSRGRLWTWIAAGGALASFAVAGGLWASVQADLEEYNDPATPDAVALEMEDPIRRKVTATNVMIGLGGVLAATAAVLFVLEGRPPSRVRPTAGADGGRLWVGAAWSF
jgi:hypothetical protein